MSWRIAAASRDPYLRHLPTISPATMGTIDDTTELLLKCSTGDREAFDRLYGHVYAELRRIAHDRLRRHPTGETLNTTGLVHEVYLRLVDQSRLAVHDRSHFLALASRAMRFVLINHAESRAAQKRGGGLTVVSLADGDAPAAEVAEDFLALNDALERLAQYDQRLSTLVECRFFGGMTYDEIAALTGRSVPTVRRDWDRARAWLHRFMSEKAGATS